jgi:hypothetical protein
MAHLVFASRTLPGITVASARGDARESGRAARDLWHVDLERRPAVLASGDLGRDQKVRDRDRHRSTTISLLVRAPGDVVKTRLPSQQATCARSRTTAVSLFIGYQDSRRLVRTRSTRRAMPVEKAAAQLDGLPRAIDGFWNARAKPLVVRRRRRRARVDVRRADASSRPVASDEHDPDRVRARGERRRGRDRVARSSRTAGRRVPRRARTARARSRRVLPGSVPTSCALGDFDGDKEARSGRRERRRQAREHPARQRRRQSFEVAPTASAGRAPHSLSVGDLDGDRSSTSSR